MARADWRLLAAVGVAAGAAYAQPDAYGCASSNVIPPSAQGGGTYDGAGCNHTGGAAGCRWANGTWSVTHNSVLHYGAVPFTAGAGDDLTTGFFLSMCADAFTANADVTRATVEFYSPLERETEMCANYAAWPGGVGANLSLGFTLERLLNCSSTDEWTGVQLADYRWDGVVVRGCPGTPVIPAAFVQPPQAVFPPNDPLDPTMPIWAGIVPSGYIASYLYGIIRETSCATNFTVLEHNATANVTRWQVLHGDAPTGYVTGCTTWLRVGRHVAFAMRFKGNPDMDVSCGSIWDPANLCCWNWTESFDGTNDGSQVKVLFDYFPDGWQPYNVSSGALPASAASGLAALALAVAVAAAATLLR